MKCTMNTYNFRESEAEMRAAIQTFQGFSNLLNIVGTIDGFHVRIKATKDSALDYFSRCQQHDLLIQANLLVVIQAAYMTLEVLGCSAIFRRTEGGNTWLDLMST